MAYKFNPFTSKLEEYGPILTGTGTVSAAADGTAALPGIAFTNDLNTGIYRPGADQLALATSGTGRLFVNSSGNVGIGTSSPQYLVHAASAVGVGADVGYRVQDTTNSKIIQLMRTGSSFSYIGIGNTEGVVYSDNTLSFAADNSNPIKFCAGGGEAARIDSSKRLLVGTTTARSNWNDVTIGTPVQIEGGNNNASFGLSIVSNSGTTNATERGGLLILGRTSGTAVGSNNGVQANYSIGQISFRGSDGTNLIAGAAIEAEVDGTPGANDMPGRLVFSTTADGAASPTERLRIDSTGQIEAGSLGTAAVPVWSFLNDPNTGIYSPGADQLALATNGTGRLFVGATGQIGITQSSLSSGGFSGGTLKIGHAPGQTAGILLQNNSTNTDSSFWYTDGTGSYLGSNNGFFAHFAGGSERLRITSTGQLSHIGAGSVGSPAVAFNGSAPSNSLVIDSTGRVGLGSSSPSKRLTIVQDGGDSALRIEQGGEGYNLYRNQVSGFLYLEGTQQTYSGFGFRVTPTGGSTTNALWIDNAGRVGVGTTSPSTALDVSGELTFSAGGAGWRTAAVRGIDEGGSYKGGMAFYTHPTAGAAGAPTERARITSSGQLLVGTSTARTNLQGASRTAKIQLDSASFNILAAVDGATISALGGSAINAEVAGKLTLGRYSSNVLGDTTLVASSDTLGYLQFVGADGTNFIPAASIIAQVDGTPGANDMPGRLVFSTTADGASSPTERMRITSQGYVFVDSSSSAFQGSIKTTSTGLKVISTTNTADAKIECFATVTDTRYGIVFANTNGIIGSISTNGSATAFNTSSDYRLKENVAPVNDGIIRLQQLKPSRFNFIADPDKMVDGFLAHEVQTVVPEAITGEKDAVDDEGNPEYQSIDQSKLVPLLTAALQEAVAKIESLEARLTAAGI